MNYIIVGLGNPGQEYEWTRHNTGRMVVDTFAKLLEVEEFEMDKKLNSLVAKTKVGKNTVMLVKPETFMNKSGNAVGPIIKSKKAAETLVVIHDELDIPFGKMKMSFNKSAGGHRGVVSVVKAVKTEAFIRLRIGISPVTAAGKMKKPQGEEVVIDLILSKFKPAEQIEFKKLAKKAAEGLEILVKDGREIATGFVNSL